MPKMKTNRTAYKKIRVGGKGKLKRGRAFTSHNTAKKTPKQRRQHRHNIVVDESNAGAIKRLLPYLRKSH